MVGAYFNDPLILVFLTFFIAVIISAFSAQKLWHFSIAKGYTAKPNHRSSHKAEVPNTGGIILFFAISIPVLVFSDLAAKPNIFYISISYLALFTIGVIDDLKNTSVRFKLLGQFITAILLILSLYDQELVIPFVKNYSAVPWVFRYVFWVIVVVVIINAYNFIDGIDGLAIGLGAFSGLAFGVYYFFHGNANLSLLGLALFGGLLGLIRQNLSLKHKMFIGDTGSLIIGGVVSLFVLRHLEMNARTELNFSSSMVFGVLFIPVSDLIRVVISRLLSGKSPMKADRTHIHHVLMDGFHISHRRTSFIIVLVQLIIFCTFLVFNRGNETGQVAFSIIMFLAYVGSVYTIQKHSSRSSLKRNKAGQLHSN